MSHPLSIDDMIARYPGTTRQSWAAMRFRGTGPKFFRVGRKIFYRVEDVTSWEEATAIARTDEQPAA